MALVAAVAVSAGGVGWWIAHAAPAASRATRDTPDRGSLGAALEHSSLAVIGRVLDIRDAGGDAELASVEILARMRGEAPAEPLPVSAPDQPRAGRVPGHAYFVPGEVSLLLLQRDGEAWTPVPGFRQAHVELDPTPALLDELAALVRDYARASDDDARVDALRRGAEIPNPMIRAGVLYDLAPLLDAGDSEFVRALLATDRPDTVRVWAVHVTAALAPDSCPPELRSLVESDPSVGVRQAALQACGARRDARDLPVLRRGLLDPSPEVREVAVQAFDTPEAVAVLRAHYAEERSEGVRRAILAQLGHQGTAEAVEALAWIEERETDAQLRADAALALRAAESTAPTR